MSEKEQFGKVQDFLFGKKPKFGIKKISPKVKTKIPKK